MHNTSRDAAQSAPWWDTEDLVIHIEDELRYEMEKPICTCRKLPHERTHAFNCPVQEAIKHCRSPRCSKRAKFTGIHLNGTAGYYCAKCKDMWIARGVLIEDTVERI